MILQGGMGRRQAAAGSCKQDQKRKLHSAKDCSLRKTGKKKEIYQQLIWHLSTTYQQNVDKQFLDLSVFYVILAMMFSQDGG